VSDQVLRKRTTAEMGNTVLSRDRIGYLPHALDGDMIGS